MSAAQAQTRGSKIMPCCPECGSKKAWKDGIRYVQDNQIQRYLCRSCGYRFSESTKSLIRFSALYMQAKTTKRSRTKAKPLLAMSIALPRRVLLTFQKIIIRSLQFESQIDQAC